MSKPKCTRLVSLVRTRNYWGYWYKSKLNLEDLVLTALFSEDSSTVKQLRN